ncbi:MAG: PqqD family protein [Porticoccaceae bacterium]
MNFNATVTLSADVLTQQVGEELVILDLGGEAYFGLDPVGARIWRLMEQGLSLGAIVDTLLGEYEVTEDVVRADVERLVDNLVEHRLATLAP